MQLKDKDCDVVSCDQTLDRDRDQLRTHDCLLAATDASADLVKARDRDRDRDRDGSCDGTAAQDRTRTQARTQSQTCDGTRDQTQTRTRTQAQAGTQTQTETQTQTQTADADSGRDADPDADRDPDADADRPAGRGRRRHAAGPVPAAATDIQPHQVAPPPYAALSPLAPAHTVGGAQSPGTLGNWTEAMAVTVRGSACTLPLHILRHTAKRSPAGSRRRSSSFYRDHHGRIYNLAARIVGDPDDAADITQEVFLRAYTHPLEARDDLRPEPWLYRIAVNASYDHLRRRAARPSTSLDTIAEIPDTSDGFVDGEIAHCVEACLAGLTPRYRTALVLKDLHGLSHAEIAEVMDIHQGAARVLLHRARTAFRRAFRSTAPTGAGGITTLGLAAFLPELPVPASLQAPPLLNLVPPATVPASPPPDLVGPATGGGHTALSGGAPTAAVPVAAAPLAPAGLLAGLGGAVAAKVAVAVIATVVVAGGGTRRRSLLGDSREPRCRGERHNGRRRDILARRSHRRALDTPADDPRASCSPLGSCPRPPGRLGGAGATTPRRPRFRRQRPGRGRSGRKQPQRRRHDEKWRRSRQQRHERDGPRRDRERRDRIRHRHGRNRRNGFW